MLISCKLEGIEPQTSNDGRTMTIVAIKGEHKCAYESVYTCDEQDCRLELCHHPVGKRIDIYVSSGASLTIDAGSTQILGGMVGARQAMMVDNTIVELNKACHVDLLFDGNVWRLNGSIYG